MERPSFDPYALAWVAARVRGVPVHRVANVEAVERLGAGPAMGCDWTPTSTGSIVLAGIARDQLGGLFCVKCWRSSS